MRVEKITAHESRFDQTGKDSHGLKHSLIKKSIEVPGEENMMDYIDAGLSSGDESYYYRNRFDKDQIVLHFTMGYLGGDIATLTKHDYHVSVPFVLGRNGTIYNLFPSFYWSYHLGRGAIGGNAARSKKSIGIEISNIGPLTLQGSNLRTAYEDIYCTTAQNEHYVQQAFRDYAYFATYTDAQYDSLVLLLRYLTARYRIPRKFLNKTNRFEAGSFVKDFRGIVSHANYRASGKVDIGPAFDWERVIAGVKA